MVRSIKKKSQRKQLSPEEYAQRTAARKTRNKARTREIATALMDVGYTLPEEWYKAEFTCSKCGDSHKVAYGYKPHKVESDVRGGRRRVIAMFLHVTKTLKAGQPEVLCYKCQREFEMSERKAKVEELLYTGEVKTEEDAWQCDEVQDLQSCAVMYFVFAELHMRETAGENPSVAMELKRRDELAECQWVDCESSGKRIPLSDMKALTRVHDGNKSEIFTLEELIHQTITLVKAGVFSNETAEFAVRVQDELINNRDWPILICAKCAQSIVEGLTNKVRTAEGRDAWRMTFTDKRGATNTRIVVERALETIKRMAKSSSKNVNPRFAEALGKLGDSMDDDELKKLRASFGLVVSPPASQVDPDPTDVYDAPVDPPPTVEKGKRAWRRAEKAAHDMVRREEFAE
ncbi:MAG: hypothetical protein U9P90_00155 [Patescibacteria group bacterium]|nr:hypothetical protein [Patescibacteria group bacterium]